MLSEQRYEMILKILEEKRSVTVTELTRLLDILLFSLYFIIFLFTIQYLFLLKILPDDF